MSNAEIETRWIDAWNELYDIKGHRSDVTCQLPDGTIINFEECRGWLQESVYAGYRVRVEAGWVGHLRGAILHRWREDDA